MANRVVVFHRAVGREAQVSIQVEVRIGADMNIGRVGRLHPKPPIVRRQILLQESVGLISRFDSPQPHLLDRGGVMNFVFVGVRTM